MDVTGSQHDPAPHDGVGFEPTHEEEAEFELKVSSTGQQHTRIASLDSNEWNQDEVQGLIVPVRRHQSSQGEASSVIRDAGYSLGSPNIANGRPPERAFDLTGLGTQFDRGISSTPHSAQAPAQTQPPNFLDTLIRTKRIPSAEKVDDHFVPIDQLELAMTPENVYRELQGAGLSDYDHSVTESICQRGKDPMQRIFAILCMIRLPGEIIEFIRLKVFDHDLPLRFQGNVAYRAVTSSSTRSEEPLSFFNSNPWEPHHCDSFRSYQRQVSAPIFIFSWTAGQKVRHYPLHSQLVLPFMKPEDPSKEDGWGAMLKRQGGTSIVRKVKIHPAHFNAQPGSPGSGSKGHELEFAVKELDVDHSAAGSNDEQDDHEALALKRLNDRHDPHLIRLLVTYTYEGRFHMVFPWADGNLKDLWETSNARDQQDLHSPELVRWMAAQILGLARALSVIHYCPVDSKNVQGFSSKDREKQHGRHGDLKPENILWFKDEESAGNRSPGTLKIADFGFADFRSEHSRSNVRRSAISGITETYRAPEYDVNNRVSPQYDIWSFGCILLQFVVWYERGWKGVDDFSKARSDESKTSIASDLFFGLANDPGRGVTASAKLSVLTMFGSLNQECSDYILDLLEYIQTYLLRLDKAKRARIEDIVKRFEKMNNQCQRHAAYCTSRTPGRRARRTDSQLSEIVEVPDPPSKDLAKDLPPVIGGIRPAHRRSASLSSQYENILGKRRQNSITQITEGDRPRSRYPLAGSSSVVPSTLSSNMNESPRQSQESPERECTMQQLASRPFKTTIANMERTFVLPDADPPSIGTYEQAVTRANSSGRHIGFPLVPQPDNRIPNVVEPKPPMHVLEPIDSPLDPATSAPAIHLDLAFKPEPPPAAKATPEVPDRWSALSLEQTDNTARQETPRGRMGQIKRRIQTRASKILNRCFEKISVLRYASLQVYTRTPEARPTPTRNTTVT